MITAAYAQAFPAVASATAGTSTRSGTLTAASVTVTGISTTVDLAVGMSVTGNGIPDGATIATIASGTSITLSQAATETGGRSLTFPADALITQLIAAAQATIETFIGYSIESAEIAEYYSGEGYVDIVLRRRPVTAIAEVRVDPSGYWGQAPSSFGVTTIQTVGVDYALVREQAASRGDAGLLRRLSGLGSSWPGWSGGLTTGGRGTLTPVRRPGSTWTPGEGNIKVTYTAGWTSDAMPADLKQCCVELVAFLAMITGTGGQAVQSESLGRYSYSLGAVTMASVAGNALAAAGELGTMRQILARYRDLAI